MNEVKKIRLFAALEMDPEAKRALSDVVEELKPSACNAKWVNPAGMHITFAFLGYRHPDDVEDLSNALRTAAGCVPAFEYTLEGIGAFPSPNRARVLWAGIGRGSDEMVRCASAVETHLEPHGYVPEKRAFTPHVTLARFRAPARIEAVAIEAAAGLLPENAFTARRLTLFESRLRPSGAEYYSLAELPLC